MVIADGFRGVGPTHGFRRVGHTQCTRAQKTDSGLETHFYTENGDFKRKLAVHSEANSGQYQHVAQVRPDSASVETSY